MDPAAAAPAAEGAPPTKKLKSDDNRPAAGTAGGHHLEPGIVSEAVMGTAEQLNAEYQAAEPYRHCVMRDLFDVSLLREVRDEIINNIQATYKETDLFKVFQTGDLGNLDSLDPEAAAKLPGLMRLKRALYSDEFRAFVTRVTGCGQLSSRTDCSCNVYAHGGHLLCHDDVIGTRRVSYIIYLTDPDDAWRADDGGALELYPCVADQDHTPATDPTLAHLPTFNTMAMFTVTPGRSFHSVQEVFSQDKPRMSISGWYHSDAPPPNADKASLQQLQLRAGADAATCHAPLSSGEGRLSDDDLGLLVRYVNPVYLSEASWPKIRARFEEEGSVQLHNFLKKDLAERIVACCVSEDAQDKLGGSQRPSYKAGVRDGWESVGPSHKQRYLRYSGSPAAAADAAGAHAGSLLARVRAELLGSPAFARLLKAFTSVTMLGQTGEVRRFRPGLDYTVAHYGVLTQDPRLDAVITFVDDATDPKAEAWQAGEVGGFEAYLLAEDEGDGKKAAEEVYRVNADAEESGVLNVNAAANTLNLVLRDEGLMRFVKYVSFAAPGSRWDIAMEYLPEDDSDDEEEDGEGKGGQEAGEEEAGGSGSAGAEGDE